ncbi:hypothetical protein V5O48_008539 [Marasmius crinis-equi]|uniref:Ketoreductase domain-containing protein n=1 Tax=Marasmius crinis-equi TaxID=585013 RepID=A0ABR3FDL8_9AGAR
MFASARPAFRAACRGLMPSRALSVSATTHKTALVTGAAQGIGRAIALRLASDGFHVCVTDLASKTKSIESVAEEIQVLGQRALAVPCDVTEMSQVEAAVQKSVDVLGPLNVMVANAGILQIRPLVDTTEKRLRNLFETNVFGVVHANVAAGKQFIRQGTGGKIINAASIAAFRPGPLVGAYCATKAAVRSLTQSFAHEYGPHKITVNAYAPGYTDTDMMKNFHVEVAKMTGLETREGDGAQAAALGRIGKPEDIANLVSFLAGPDSDFITGQTMIADGGVVFS